MSNRSKQAVWKKLITPALRRVKFVMPPHYTRNNKDTGWVIEGTDTPFNPDTYNEADYTVWLDDWNSDE